MMPFSVLPSRNRVRLPALSLLVAATLACVLHAGNASEANLVANGDFENASLAPWNWALNRGAQATASLDDGDKFVGRAACKLTSTSRRQPHVYGGLHQIVKNLEPNTRYTLSAWVKGEKVSGAWIGGGLGWKVRAGFPRGTFDWQEVATSFVTGAETTAFEIVILVEDITTALWIDNVVLTKASPIPSDEAARIFPVARYDTFPASLRVAPIMPLERMAGVPPVTIRSSGASPLGANLRLAYDTLSLYCHIDVIDPTNGPSGQGEMMWNADSIQVAIDVSRDAAHGDKTNTYYELGFALHPSGDIATYAWAGNFDWNTVRAEGHRTPDGYRLEIQIPWENLSVAPSRLPATLGVNLVVNDAGQGRRRFVEWTPATAVTKNPDHLASAILIPATQQPAACLSLDRTVYDMSQDIHGRYIEYAGPSSTPARLALALFPSTTPSGRSRIPLIAFPDLELPVTDKGVNVVNFQIPSRLVHDEGAYIIEAGRAARETPVQPVAMASLERIHLRTRIKEKHLAAQTRWQRLETTAATDANPYAKLAMTIIEYFMKQFASRDFSATAIAQADLEWVQLQLDETQYVMDALEQIRDQATPLPRPAPQTTSYRYGYGHLSGARADLHKLPGMGASLMQQERGPRDMKPDGTLTPSALSVRELLDDAQAAGLKIDLLLSPHYFPRWALQKNPSLALTRASGTLGFKIDHPESRDVIKKWLHAIIPLIKNHPALFSVCLANEPTYSHSGRDEHSRPAWTSWLRQQHGDIGLLNRRHGSRWADFEKVPVPSVARPSQRPALGTYYDWIRFNQQHFAEWHRWMNDIIKSIAPDLATHIKIMANILDPALLSRGAEPELFCRITDFAGNDAWAFPGSAKGYAYDWQQMQIWYDLLHSFRGQPVYNSENHLIRDRTPPVPVPPAHTRSVLWQGALHHQKSTAIWVWDKPRTPDLEGNISLRPANIYAAGRTMIDLNRFASEVSTISDQSARIAILYSIPSLYWNPNYSAAVTSAYTALTFMGESVTFISETQLTDGTRSSANRDISTIILPGATHVSPPALQSLARFAKNSGNLIALGTGNLERDEYDEPQSTAAQPTRIAWTPQTPDHELAVHLRAKLSNLGVASKDTLLDADGEVPAWGVEYRIVRECGRTLVSLVNLLEETKTVNLMQTGNAFDLLSGQPIDLHQILLRPMEPRLIEITPP